MSLPRLVGLPLAQQESAKVITASRPRPRDRGLAQSSLALPAAVMTVCTRKINKILNAAKRMGR